MPLLSLLTRAIGAMLLECTSIHCPFVRPSIHLNSTWPQAVCCLCCLCCFGGKNILFVISKPDVHKAGHDVIRDVMDAIDKFGP